jgi:Nuclease-related domain
MEPSSRHPPIRLDHDTRCQSCGKRLVAGDLVAIGQVSDTIVCVTCTVDLPNGKAGGSAQREYDRRRQRRHDHARRTLGLIGAVLAHVIEEPQSTKSWAQGARGERRTAVRLEKHLAGHPVKLLHDRRIPGRGKANLDHLAVGPGGITVIDSKTHRGEVRVERVGGLFTDRRSILTIGGRDQTKLIDGVERQVKLVVAALRSAGFADVDVRGALCFPDPDGLPIRQLSVRGIVIDGPKPVAKLARRAGPLSADHVDQLAHQLATLFAEA